jgi:DNA-binding NarL/FixJ family response regulator
VERHQQLSEDAPPILVFASHLNLPLAHEAIRSGASGFIHAEMKPDQLARAIAVAIEGELAAPRALISYLISLEDEAPANTDGLSARQREILEFVAEGLSNADIAKRLYLSESTIKQHLRAAYKLLGVNNRIEAANLIRRSG